MTGGSNDVNSRKCVPFWVFYVASYLGVKPPKYPFWGVNRHFQAKVMESKNMHIVKTTASIPTKFCTVIKTTKCPSWVILTHALQIQDGGLPWSKNYHISALFVRFQPNLARWRSSTFLTQPIFVPIKSSYTASYIKTIAKHVLCIKY